MPSRSLCQNATVSVASAAVCQNHPRREAIGVCVRCRAQICSECVTKVDGINHCVGCLNELAESSRLRAASEARASRPRAITSLVLFGGLLWVLTWAWLYAVLPGGGG